MACYHPIPAYRGGPGGDVTLWPPKGTENLAIPCTTCIGCKSARARQWANRSEHEARAFQHNTFLTLTYDDDNLPPDGELDAAELTRFLKRLRKAHKRDPDRIERDPNHNLRYLGCGEYGSENFSRRPHYHLILYNCGFRPGSRRVGKDLWESPVLDELWGKGIAAWGPATPGAANYIAQYTLKKQQRDRATRNPGYVDADGVYYDRPAKGRRYLGHQEPFIRMSLKPAIGARWLDKFKGDLEHGYLVAGGTRTSIPRAYIKRLELHDPHLAEAIKINQATHRRTINPDNYTEERLRAGEEIHKRMKQLTERRTL